MKNPIQKFRQSSIVFEKPGTLSGWDRQKDRERERG